MDNTETLATLAHKTQNRKNIIHVINQYKMQIYLPRLDYFLIISIEEINSRQQLIAETTAKPYHCSVRLH
jgi:Trk K+ transport system NAD-binding subunit